MISLLMGFGLSKMLARLVAWVAIPALVLLAAYAALDAYGDKRYSDGRAAEGAVWKEAQFQLLRQAAESATRADTAAIAREMEYAAKVEAEKERLDDAIANGGSPLDVLFGADSVQTGESVYEYPNTP